MSQIVSGPATSYDLLISAPDPREPLKSKERSDVALITIELFLFYLHIFFIPYETSSPFAFVSFKSNAVQSPAMKMI